MQLKKAVPIFVCYHAQSRRNISSKAKFESRLATHQISWAKHRARPSQSTSFRHRTELGCWRDIIHCDCFSRPIAWARLRHVGFRKKKKTAGPKSWGRLGLLSLSLASPSTGLLGTIWIKSWPWCLSCLDIGGVDPLVWENIYLTQIYKIINTEPETWVLIIPYHYPMSLDQRNARRMLPTCRSKQTTHHFILYKITVWYF